MKKMMTIAMIMIATMAFSQMEITRNRLMAGAEFMYIMQEKAAVMDLTVPGIGYEFEAKPNDMFKLYLYGNAGYEMYQESYDGETVVDNWGSEMYFELEPAVKAYLPNSLFAKVILPFNFYNITPQYVMFYDDTVVPPVLYLDEDPDSYSMNNLDANIQFGFDNREIFIHGLTPWDHFEKGMIGYAFYNMGLMASFDGEAADELGSWFGVYGAYAHYAENMMIKPFLKYEMGMNDLIDEDGHLYLGLDFVKDFTETVNLEAGLDYYMQMPADSDVDGASHLALGALVNYYVMPELDVFGGFGYWMDMTKDNETDPIMTITIGAEYTLNLLK